MERNHFFVCHAGEVVYYIMCFASDGFTCIGGGKSDHCCPGSHSGLQAVERIFKDVGVFGGGFKDFHPEQEAVGSRFGTGKHLSGQDAVYHSFKFGVGIVDVSHLLFVGAGDYGYLCTVTAKIGYKGFYSGDVFVGHLLLVNVEFGASGWSEKYFS